MGDAASVRAGTTRERTRAAVILAVGSPWMLGACGDPRPAQPPPISATFDGVDAGAGGTGLRFEPPADPAAVAPITRVSVRLSQPLSTEQVALVRGALTAAQLRDLGRPALPDALAARVVPAVIWAEPDPSLVTAAPLSALQPGALYTMAVSAPAQAWSFTVSAEASRPVLARLWPTTSVAVAQRVVWCGASALPPFTTPALLAPAERSGTFQLGTGALAATPACVSWSALAERMGAAGGLPALSPPSLWVGDEDVALEPAVLVAGDPGASTPALTCAPGEVPFATGCADVQDDRVVVRAPEQPVLWTIAGVGPVLVRSTAAQERFVLRPLSSGLSLLVTTLDARGETTSAALAILPGRVRPHLVINEVMANPRGPEPAQEWVELVNDGQSAVALAGFTLEDAQGSTVLPEASLSPGELALIVGRGYVPRADLDPAPPAATQLLRIDALALSNDGERLTLRDGSGAVVSVFPTLKSKNGVSWVRRHPDGDDADPAAFALCSSPAGSTPGSAN